MFENVRLRKALYLPFMRISFMRYVALLIAFLTAGTALCLLSFRAGISFATSSFAESWIAPTRALIVTETSNAAMAVWHQRSHEMAVNSSSPQCLPYSNRYDECVI